MRSRAGSHLYYEKGGARGLGRGPGAALLKVELLGGA